jgi:hypothetical protein
LSGKSPKLIIQTKQPTKLEANDVILKHLDSECILHLGRATIVSYLQTYFIFDESYLDIPSVTNSLSNLIKVKLYKIKKASTFPITLNIFFEKSFYDVKNDLASALSSKNLTVRKFMELKVTMRKKYCYVSANVLSCFKSRFLKEKRENGFNNKNFEHLSAIALTLKLFSSNFCITNMSFMLNTYTYNKKK